MDKAKTKKGPRKKVKMDLQASSDSKSESKIEGMNMSTVGSESARDQPRHETEMPAVEPVNLTEVVLRDESVQNQSRQQSRAHNSEVSQSGLNLVEPTAN